MEDLLTEAQAWLAADPDPDTRAELGALIAAHDLDALAERFSTRLAFGTAGLRGALGAGPNRMNRSVVTATAAGLCAFLTARTHSSGAGSVVIGYDARHKSEAFARDTAEVVQGAGLRALVLPRPLPTPVLAFAVRHLGADAGVMVTASHNPAQDNGYKVYLGDGSQIVPPADAEISAEIDAVGPVPTIVRGAGATVLGEDLVEAYLAAAAGVVAQEGPRELSVVYTPLHGVGRDLLLAAWGRAGFTTPYVVAAQGEPDPDFPTVAFPNPEEPGAMDLALAAAAERGADLVLANDPDADRAAVAVPVVGGGWRMLTGDEVGALLATHLLRRHPGLTGTFAASIVSSSLLARIAAVHGLTHTETLTGFKWIARAPGLRFGYEEALGYCVDPGSVRDKDGITALLLVAELAATLRAEGRTLLDLLDDLAREHGVHATGALSVRVTDLGEITAAMARLREHPPTTLAGRTVTSAEDLAEGSGGLPPTDGLRYHLDGGARVVVRPSGTEPKLKCYLEVVVPVTGDVAAARAVGARAVEALRGAVAEAAGLAPPSG